MRISDWSSDVCSSDLTTGAIGLPFAGNVVKLAPVGDRLEIRVKGLTVTPGYLGDAEATAAAFDEEGFYRTGDAARFVDPARPELGLAFDGRVTENFKLLSGTWRSEEHTSELQSLMRISYAVFRL